MGKYCKEVVGSRGELVPDVFEDDPLAVVIALQHLLPQVVEVQFRLLGTQGGKVDVGPHFLRISGSICFLLPPLPQQLPSVPLDLPHPLLLEVLLSEEVQALGRGQQLGRA